MSVWLASLHFADAVEYMLIAAGVAIGAPMGAGGNKSRPYTFAPAKGHFRFFKPV